MAIFNSYVSLPEGNIQCPIVGGELLWIATEVAESKFLFFYGSSDVVTWTKWTKWEMG